MYIGSIMHTNLVTISPKTTLVQSKKIMKDNPIDHLLVVNDTGDLVGIISDRDLKQYWASPATTLSNHELGYLLEKVEAEMIMAKSVITISPATTVERAAYIMQVNNINALPVKEGDKLVGIITSTDVMGVLLNAIGMGDNSVRLSVLVKDSIGTLSSLTEILKKEEINIQSMFTTPLKEYPGITQLVMRVTNSDSAKAISTLKSFDYKVLTQYEKDITPFLPKD